MRQDTACSPVRTLNRSAESFFGTHLLRAQGSRYRSEIRISRFRSRAGSAVQAERSDVPQHPRQRNNRSMIRANSRIVTTTIVLARLRFRSAGHDGIWWLKIFLPRARLSRRSALGETRGEWRHYSRESLSNYVDKFRDRNTWRTESDKQERSCVAMTMLATMRVRVHVDAYNVDA